MCGIDMKYMRLDVAKLYPGRKWRSKVDKMSDAQVMAIYMKSQQPKKDSKSST